jgi:hypothetical protein
MELKRKLNPVYICRYDQIFNEFPIDSELIIIDHPTWKERMVNICNKYFGKEIANMHTPSSTMVIWLDAIDISEQ